MDIADVQAVIESARTRGREPLIRYLRRQMPEAGEAQVEDTADLAVEIIDSVPVLMARAAQAAEERNLVPVVTPLLERAVIYFTRPVDLIPEMTHGLAGLLDDTYLVLRILENLERGPTPLVEWELGMPLRFLRSLLGNTISRQLDDLSVLAMQGVSRDLGALWSELSIEA
jgi:uncharacterized membrane protein YkvA (DUF1232 family)